MNNNFASHVANAQAAINEMKEIIQKYEARIGSFSADDQKIIREKIIEAKAAIAKHKRYIAKVSHIDMVKEHFENTIPEMPVITRLDGTVAISQNRGIVALTDSLRPIILARVNNVAVVYIATIERDVVLAEIYVGENMTEETHAKIAKLIARYSIER